jgi:hypothetical protein
MSPVGTEAKKLKKGARDAVNPPLEGEEVGESKQDVEKNGKSGKGRKAAASNKNVNGELEVEVTTKGRPRKEKSKPVPTEDTDGDSEYEFVAKKKPREGRAAKVKEGGQLAIGILLKLIK